MQPSIEPRLSQAEWVVLCLLREGRAHGWTLAASLSPDSDLGKIWDVQKSVVYRALGRLEQLGFARWTEAQAGLGPVRSPAAITPKGRRAAET